MRSRKKCLKNDDNRYYTIQHSSHVCSFQCSLLRLSIELLYLSFYQDLIQRSRAVFPAKISSWSSVDYHYQQTRLFLHRLSHWNFPMWLSQEARANGNILTLLLSKIFPSSTFSKLYSFEKVVTVWNKIQLHKNQAGVHSTSWDQHFSCNYRLKVEKLHIIVKHFNFFLQRNDKPRRSF